MRLTAAQFQKMHGGNIGSQDVARKAKPQIKHHENHTRNSGPYPVVERSAVHDSLETAHAQEINQGRVLVRVTSVRKRLLDEDNLCEKFHVDCCRYAGLIRNDSPGEAKIEVAQRKAAKGEAEKVIIEISSNNPLCPPPAGANHYVT